MRRLLLTAVCLSALAAGCERIDAPADAAKVIQVPPGEGVRILTRPDPRLSVAHAGERRIELTPDADTAVVFRESVATDGHGQFSIQPLGPQGTTVPDWGLFELTQRAREGFLFRYRDFSVRDPQLFEQNWSVASLGTTAVAGRACRVYRIERVIGGSVAYELSLDEQTSLILASREFDTEGRLVASMAYETFRLEPDLGSIVWHVPGNEERPLDPQENPDPVLQPRLLPDGFAPLEVASVSDGQGTRWIKRTYSDGVEPLFFFQGLSESAPGKPLYQHSASSSAPAQSPSAVIVFHLGAVTVIQGELAGFDLMVIGKASEEELLDLIESALP